MPVGTYTYTFSTGTFVVNPSGWTTAFPTSGTNPIYVSYAVASGSTATVNLTNANFSTPVLLVQNGTNGTPGTSVAQVVVYRRFAGAPTNVAGGPFEFTFSTGLLTATPTDWSQTFPTSGTDPVYVSRAIASASTATVNIAAASFSTPVLFVANGTNGTPGSSSALVYLYQRAASTPALPSVSSTYTFVGGGLTGQNNGWTQTLPAGSNPLYVTTASAVGTGASVSIPSNAWAAAAVLAQDGSPGASGANTAIVFLFQRTTTSTAPAVPNVDSTFTFSSGVLANHNNGWTALGPAGATTDLITPANWSTPAISGQDGTNGNNGAAAITITMNNVACQLWAYADGTVLSFAQAVGNIKVYDGASDVTGSATYSSAASGCTGTVNAAGAYSVTAMSADQATLTITIQYLTISYTRVFALAKSRGGYEIVSSLPTTGNLFNGRVVFLTTDSKLYSYRTATSSWVNTVNTTDLSGSITSAQIAAVDALKITGAITETQIATDAVTSSKIFAGAVVAGKIGANAVTAGTIEAGAVTADKIFAGAVTTAKLDAGAVTADKIFAGTITSAQITGTTLSAIRSNLGEITAGSLNINGKFVVDASGNVTIQSTGAAYLKITNSLIEVHDGTRVRVRVGIW